MIGILGHKRECLQSFLFSPHFLISREGSRWAGAWCLQAALPPVGNSGTSRDMARSCSTHLNPSPTQPPGTFSGSSSLSGASGFRLNKGQREGRKHRLNTWLPGSPMESWRREDKTEQRRKFLTSPCGFLTQAKCFQEYEYFLSWRNSLPDIRSYLSGCHG